jgi:hypothetical protein
VSWASAPFLMALKFQMVLAFGRKREGGLPYSTWKTGLPARTNSARFPHSAYWKHCSLTA